MSYQLEKINGCTIVYGSLPIMEMVGLMTASSDDSVQISFDLALKLNASLVAGSPSNLKQLSALPEIRDRIRENQQQIIDTAGVQVSKEAFAWLVDGERGKSSDSMFGVFTGIQAMQHGSHPHDAADFRRCALLLEQVPEFSHKLALMANVSDVWSGLVPKWNELCALLSQDSPVWRKELEMAPGFHQALTLICAARR